MKSLWTRLLMLTAAGALILSACNYPGATAPTPFVFPTPDLTLTVIYSTLLPLTQVPTLQADTATPPPTQAGPPLVTATGPVPQPATATLAPQPATALPSPFPTATNQPAPTVTNTAGPQIRTGAAVDATYLSTRPTIDGNLTEWRLTPIRINRVTFGANLWDGVDDLDAEAMVGWDDEYLFLGIRVVDEDYVQNATRENLYQGDSIEVLIDANLAADFNDRNLSSDDFQLGISPGNPSPGENKEAYLWYPREQRGVIGTVQIGATRRDQGYDVEIAIPWSIFGIDPDNGDHFGFVLSVSDNDRTGRVEQQTMISNISTRSLTNPTTWGDLELVGR